ncbi:MAG: alpha/beta fold hydrolase [Blastocatellia bacterium]
MFPQPKRALALLLFLWLPVIHAMSAQTNPGQTDNDSLNAAIRQFEAKQYAEATAALEKILAAEPGNVTAITYLGRVALARNNGDEAIKWLEKAVSLHARHAATQHWLAQAYGQKARTGSLVSRAGLAQKARDALLRAIELDPEHLDARADLARYYDDVPAIIGGSESKAIEQAEFIKKRDPLKGNLLAGEIFADKQKNNEAETAYREAEKHQTAKFEATMALGLFCLRTKQFDKAFAAYDKVLAASPADLWASYHLGRAAGMSRQNLARGLAAFDAIRDRLPKENRDAWIGWHWWRANIIEAMGDTAKAHAEYEALDRLSPNHPDTRAALERTKPAAAATSGPRAPGLITLTPSSFSSHDGEVTECEAGRLRVPENRAHKNSRLLELAFIRLKTTAASPRAPVVFLAGGPGGSGIQTGRVREFLAAAQAMRRHADVILLDQRGTGASEPDMRCAGEFRELPATALRSRQDMVQAFSAPARRCADEKRAKGIDFAGWTILDSADDIEDLRRALGVPKVSLWGHSYGTQLALATARRHARGIERLVLMGVEGVESTSKFPADLDRYISELAVLVKNDVRVGAQVPDLAGLIRTVLTKLDREPVTVAYNGGDNGARREMVVGGDGLRLLTLLTLLNDTRSLPLLPALFASLARGETTGLATALSAAQGRALPNADWFLIDGASGVSKQRQEQIRREIPGSLFGDFANFLITDLASVWRPRDLGDDFRQPVKSDLPALFISGALDANTPPHRAGQVRHGFANSAHIVIDNAGHQDHLRAPGLIAVMADFIAGKKVESQRLALPIPEFLPLATAP